MLSILIPIYNFNITELVKALHAQGVACQIPFEIICFDDGSTLKFKKENAGIQNFEHLIYQELSQNLGRAKIRNALAKAAKFPYLLFLDCDAKVINTHYLKKYLEQLSPKAILYGGRVYNAVPPVEKKFKLHYHFGKKREEISVLTRQSKPYFAFMTNNFLIAKAQFLSILFDETIEGYGHEDTLFGTALATKKIEIIHIDNPLEHIGLEDYPTFLKKQKEAIKNLYWLHRAGASMDTKLLKTFIRLKKYGLDKGIFFGLNQLKNIIDAKLKATTPNLFWLDLFKLHQLLLIDKNGIDNLPN